MSAEASDANDVTTKSIESNAFPDFMFTPISRWLYEVLRIDAIDEDTLNSYRDIKGGFQDYLQLTLHEIVPLDWDNFVAFTLADTNRTLKILLIVLNIYATNEQAVKLEVILSKANSHYMVTLVDEAKQNNQDKFDITERIPTVIKSMSKRAVTDNELLKEAWNLYYSQYPDYEKVVSRCCSFLEGFYKKRYFTDDPKPQITKFIHNFANKPEILSYKGDSIVKPKNVITSLLEEAANIRAEHLAGLGRKPTKDEANFVLHTTIYIWNLHNGIK